MLLEGVGEVLGGRKREARGHLRSLLGQITTRGGRRIPFFAFLLNHLSKFDKIIIIYYIGFLKNCEFVLIPTNLKNMLQ